MRAWVGGGGGGRVGGSGWMGREQRSETCVKIQKKKFFFFGGEGRGVRVAGGQGGWEWRSDN